MISPRLHSPTPIFIIPNICSKNHSEEFRQPLPFDQFNQDRGAVSFEGKCYNELLFCIIKIGLMYLIHLVFPGSYSPPHEKIEGIKLHLQIIEIVPPEHAILKK